MIAIILERFSLENRSLIIGRVKHENEDWPIPTIHLNKENSKNFLKTKSKHDYYLLQFTYSRGSEYRIHNTVP